jgi:hypothetical protein
MVVAQMGIIAIIVKGQIIHVTFNFNLHGKPQSAQPRIKDIEIYVGPCLLIIEKASTCAQVSLRLIDACLRQLREYPTIDTSSTHIFYYDDWFQLVLTVGPTLFTKPYLNASIQNWDGYNFYKKINHLVYWTKIMCQQNNLDFVTSLRRFCTGILNSHDVDAINLRHIDFNIVITTFEFKPILLTSNLLRITFNYSCAKLFGIQRDPQQYNSMFKSLGVTI